MPSFEAVNLEFMVEKVWFGLDRWFGQIENIYNNAFFRGA